MLEVLRREFIYLWYYFTIQFEQIFQYYTLGIVLGLIISAFGKNKIHQLFTALQKKKLGALGVIPASIIGIASPLCMYGTIPISASFSEKGMKDDWLAAFMMSSILLNNNSISQFLSGIKDTVSGMNTGNLGTICIPVYLGGTLLDEVVVNAQNWQNLRSGGR